jgi:hypothetical protein
MFVNLSVIVSPDESRGYFISVTSTGKVFLRRLVDHSFEVIFSFLVNIWEVKS